MMKSSERLKEIEDSYQSYCNKKIEENDIEWLIDRVKSLEAQCEFEKQVHNNCATAQLKSQKECDRLSKLWIEEKNKLNIAMKYLRELPKEYSCHCDGGYKERGLIAPDCVVHDLQAHVDEAFEKINEVKCND